MTFKAFLQSYIDSTDSRSLEKASLARMVTHYMHIYTYYSAMIGLLLGDIQKHTCDIDRNIIDKTISQYNYLQRNAQIFADYFDKTIALSDLDEEAKKKLEMGNVEFKTSFNKEQVTVTVIRFNLKQCK